MAVKFASVCEPEVAFAPLHAPLAEQEVALVLDHDSVDELPVVTDVGDAERETVGAEVGGGVVLCVVADTPVDCADTFPAASVADTVYVYAVDAVSPVSL